ncbi:MAG: stalk domain-containing protein, partial [Alkaliphilus sp.]
LSFDVPPTIIQGRTLVPLRAIFEALGATVSWDGETRTIIGVKDNVIINLIVDSKNAFRNGQLIVLDVPATIINGRTMVPGRFIGESLGAIVDWNQETRTVVITTQEESQTHKEILLLVREDLAKHLGISLQDIEVISAESVEWSDASLGIPGGMAAQVITPGYIVTLRHDNTEYIYHTDTGHSFVRITEDEKKIDFSVSIEVEGLPLTSVNPEEKIVTTCNTTHPDSNNLIYTWSSNGGTFSNETGKTVEWTAFDSHGIYTISVSVSDGKGNTVTASEDIIVGEVSGLMLDYYFSLEGNAGNRPRMKVEIKNIKTDFLTFVINGAVVDLQENELFKTIDNITVRDKNEDDLSVSFSKKTITPENWYWFGSFDHDLITIDTRGEDKVIIEYDIASSLEIWEGLGGASFWLDEDPKDVWFGYLENILYRPLERTDINSAKLLIDLPVGWNYAAVYPQSYDIVDLGTMDYMYGDNSLRWKNYQRAPFILFREGPFHLASRIVRGVEVKDVYTTHVKARRNHEAQYEYFQYLSDNIGELPINAVLTFSIGIDSNKTPHYRDYQTAPYGGKFGHGLMGEYFGTGGDIGIEGDSLGKPQLWDFYSVGDEKSYSFAMHGTVRYWLVLFVQMEGFGPNIWVKCGLTTYYENMAVASRYGLETVIERRFKLMYEYYQEHIVTPQGEKDRKDFDVHQFIQYFKQGLVFFYINELIEEYSGGEKNLYDAVKIIYEDALLGKPATREGLINALNSLNVYDFTDIINDYIYGNKILNLDRYFYE